MQLCSQTKFIQVANVQLIGLSYDAHIRHRHAMGMAGTDFTHTHTKRKKKGKSEASDTIQHNTLSILKYLCIIGPKSDSGDD